MHEPLLRVKLAIPRLGWQYSGGETWRRLGGITGYMSNLKTTVLVIVPRTLEGLDGKQCRSLVGERRRQDSSEMTAEHHLSCTYCSVCTQASTSVLPRHSCPAFACVVVLNIQICSTP